MSHASDKFPHHNPLGVGTDKHGGKHSHKRCFKSCSSGHCTPISNLTQNGKDQEHRETSCNATANLSMIGQFISCSHFVLCKCSVIYNCSQSLEYALAMH